MEVRFDFWIPDNDLTLLSIPIEKLWKLESLLKEQLVCHISEALKAENNPTPLLETLCFSDDQHNSSVDRQPTIAI